MGLFAIACGVVIVTGLFAGAKRPEGVLVVPLGAWLALLALLGAWFVWLIYLST